MGRAVGDNSENLSIRPVPHADSVSMEAIHHILTEAGLPVPGQDDPPVFFMAAEKNGGIIGCAGWEAHPPSALIRSVAIDGKFRGSGAGTVLIRHAVARLAERNVETVFLVTLDADPFFARFGFEPISREEVPDPVRQSPEYTLHQCESGQWMRLKTGTPGKGR